MIVWPKIPPALLALLPTLPGWSRVEVFDGPPVTQGAPSAYCTVGYVLDEGSGGTFNQELGPVDGLREESGEVRCELVVSTGDVDIASVRSAAGDLVDALDAALRTDQSLGGLLSHGSSVVLGADFLPVQNTSGASVRVAMSVQYFTRSQ